jgi:hypothetical protein
MSAAAVDSVVVIVTRKVNVCHRTPLHPDRLGYNFEHSRI